MPTSLFLVLQQQLQQLVQLNELLLCERDALSSRSPEKVEQLAQQKLTVLEQIQQTDKHISDNFSTAEFSSDDIKTIKIDIDNALADAKKQNLVNAKILQHNQVTVGLLKDLIIGSKKDKSATTYDQLGKRTNTLKSRPIKA